MSTINNNDINTQRVGGLGPNPGAPNQTSDQATDAERQAVQAALTETANSILAETQGEIISTDFLANNPSAETQTGFSGEASYPAGYEDFYFHELGSETAATTANRSDYIVGNKLYLVFFEGSGEDDLNEFSYEEDGDGNSIATFVYGEGSVLILKKNEDGAYVLEDEDGNPVEVDEIQPYIDKMQEILDSHSLTDPIDGQTKTYNKVSIVEEIATDTTGATITNSFTNGYAYTVSNVDGVITTSRNGEIISAKTSANGTEYSFEKGTEANSWIYKAETDGAEYTTYIRATVNDQGEVTGHEFQQADGPAIENNYQPLPDFGLEEEHLNMINQFSEIAGLGNIEAGVIAPTNTRNVNGRSDSSWENEDGEIYKLTSDNPGGGFDAYSWEQDPDGISTELLTISEGEQIRIVTGADGDKTFYRIEGDDEPEITNTTLTASYEAQAAAFYSAHSAINPEEGQSKTYKEDGFTVTVSNTDGYINTVKTPNNGGTPIEISSQNLDASTENILTINDDSTMSLIQIEERNGKYHALKYSLDASGEITKIESSEDYQSATSDWNTDTIELSDEALANISTELDRLKEIAGIDIPDVPPQVVREADGHIDTVHYKPDGSISSYDSVYKDANEPGEVSKYEKIFNDDGTITELITVITEVGTGTGTATIEIHSDGDQKAFTYIDEDENATPITSSFTQLGYSRMAAELDKAHVETTAEVGETETYSFIINGTDQGSTTEFRTTNTGDHINQVVVENPGEGNETVTLVSSRSLDGSTESIFDKEAQTITEIEKQSDGTFHARKYTVTGDAISKIETTENYLGEETSWDQAAIDLLDDTQEAEVLAELDRLKEIGGIGEDLPPPATDTYTAEGHIDTVNYDAEGNIASYESDYSGENGDLELSSGVTKYKKTINEDGSTTETLVFEKATGIGTITIDTNASGVASITQTSNDGVDTENPPYSSNYIDLADRLFDQHSATDPVNGRESYILNEDTYVIKEQTGNLMNSFQFSATEGSNQLDRVGSEYADDQVGGSFLVFNDSGSTYYNYTASEDGKLQGLRIEYDQEGEIQEVYSITDFNLDEDFASQPWIPQRGDVVLAGNEDLYAGDYEKLMDMAQEARTDRMVELATENAADSYTANGRSDFVTYDEGGQIATLFSDLGPFSSEYNTYKFEYSSEYQQPAPNNGSIEVPKHTLVTDDYTFVIYETEREPTLQVINNKTNQPVPRGIFDKNQILKEAQELRGSNHFNQLTEGESFEYTETINGVDIVTNRSKSTDDSGQEIEIMYRALPNGGNIFEYQETQNGTTSNLKIMGNGQQLLTITNAEGELQLTRDGAHGGITSAKFKAAGLDSYTDNALITVDHRSIFDSLYNSLTDKNVDMSTTSNFTSSRTDSQVRYGNYAYVLKSELGNSSGFNFGTQNISEYSYEQINRNNSVESFTAGTEQYLVYKTNGEIQSIQKKTNNGYAEEQYADPEAHFGVLDELRATHSYNTFVDGEITTENAQGGTSTISQTGNIITTESTDNNGARTSISQQFLTGPIQSITKINSGALKAYYTDKDNFPGEDIPNAYNVHSVEKIILSEGLEMIVYKNKEGEVLDQIFTNGDEYPNHPNATRVYDMAESLIQPMETNIRVGGDSRFAGTIDLTTAEFQYPHKALDGHKEFNNNDWSTVTFQMTDGSTLMMGSRWHDLHRFISLTSESGDQQTYVFDKHHYQVKRMVNGEMMGTQYFRREDNYNYLYHFYNHYPSIERDQWVNENRDNGDSEQDFFEEANINAGNYMEIFDAFPNMDSFFNEENFRAYLTQLGLDADIYKDDEEEA